MSAATEAFPKIDSMKHPTPRKRKPGGGMTEKADNRIG
jgi:hypothetical protein